MTEFMVSAVPRRGCDAGAAGGGRSTPPSPPCCRTARPRPRWPARSARSPPGRCWRWTASAPRRACWAACWPSACRWMWWNSGRRRLRAVTRAQVAEAAARGAGRGADTVAWLLPEGGVIRSSTTPLHPADPGGRSRPADRLAGRGPFGPGRLRLLGLARRRLAGRAGPRGHRRDGRRAADRRRGRRCAPWPSPMRCAIRRSG